MKKDVTRNYSTPILQCHSNIHSPGLATLPFRWIDDLFFHKEEKHAWEKESLVWFVFEVENVCTSTCHFEKQFEEFKKKLGPESLDMSNFTSKKIHNILRILLLKMLII